MIYCIKQNCNFPIPTVTKSTRDLKATQKKKINVELSRIKKKWQNILNYRRNKQKEKNNSNEYTINYVS